MYVCMCVQICVLNTIVFFLNNTYLEDPESLGSGSELNRNSLQKSLNLYAHRGKMTKTTFRTQYMQLLMAIFSHSMGPILDNSQGIRSMYHLHSRPSQMPAVPSPFLTHLQAHQFFKVPSSRHLGLFLFSWFWKIKLNLGIPIKFLYKNLLTLQTS